MSDITVIDKITKIILYIARFCYITDIITSSKNTIFINKNSWKNKTLQTTKSEIYVFIQKSKN